jgi:hypothetical protein
MSKLGEQLDEHKKLVGEIMSIKRGWCFLKGDAIVANFKEDGELVLSPVHLTLKEAISFAGWILDLVGNADLQPEPKTKKTEPSVQKPLMASLRTRTAGLTPQEASQYLGLSTSKLQKLRSSGLGAPFIKYGEGKTARIFYPLHELDTWINRNLRKTVG